jgi:Xaa-Pro aminopeptidase
MILSNEPGYYRAGGWGIRIENLIVVHEAPPGVDAQRKMLGFETLTLCPIDTGLLLRERLSADEAAWLNAYHARVMAALAPQVSDGARAWLASACAPV